MLSFLTLWATLALSSTDICAIPNVHTGGTRYLAFQVFTGSQDPEAAIGDSGFAPLGPMPPPQELDRFVQDIIDRIGTVGTRRNRLAVIFGPISFDQSDVELQGFISRSFDLALKRGVAIGFHLDDSMFWARRSDLWRNPDNVEWMDWNRTTTTGRRIEWGPKPKMLPPQMCFNSKAIQAEVWRRSKGVIGKAIKFGVDRLTRKGRPDLFAGVIVGWETQMGQDFPTGRYLGYHALANRGFGKSHPPRDVDIEREEIVQEFITLWCKGLASAGLPITKLYSHTAFLSRRVFDGLPEHAAPYSEQNHFAPPSVSFGKYREPGFSTYPQPGLFDKIYAELGRHGGGGWSSSEGTNLQLGSGPGQSGMNMETYLAHMFNHGATLTNIFSWGVGGNANKNMDFRVVTEGVEALSAYRKFLRGDHLLEAEANGSSYLVRLPAKIDRIQRQLPVWVRKPGNRKLVEPIMLKLDAALKAKEFSEAEKLADKILNLLAR